MNTSVRVAIASTLAFSLPGCALWLATACIEPAGFMPPELKRFTTTYEITYELDGRQDTATLTRRCEYAGTRCGSSAREWVWNEHVGEKILRTLPDGRQLVLLAPIWCNPDQRAPYTANFDDLGLPPVRVIDPARPELRPFASDADQKGFHLIRVNVQVPVPLK